MTAQLPDLKTLNNSRLYIKINNPAEFKKEFRVGDEIIFCSPLSNNDIYSVLIIEINDSCVKYTNAKPLNCRGHFKSYIRIEYLFPNSKYTSPLHIFKVRGPSCEDIQNKKDNIREVNEFILEERLRPVNLDEVGISFVGEDYREGRTAFYKNTFNTKT